MQILHQITPRVNTKREEPRIYAPDQDKVPKKRKYNDSITWVNWFQTNEIRMNNETKLRNMKIMR